MKSKAQTAVLMAILMIALPLLLAACSGGVMLADEPDPQQVAPAVPEGGQDPLPAPETTQPGTPEVPVADEPRVSVHQDREYSFALDVWDETYAYGGSVEEYEIVYYPYEGDYPWWTGDQFPYEDHPEFDPPEPYEPDLLAVEVWARGADGLRAFCCDLTFENESLRLEYSQVNGQFIAAPMVSYAADDCHNHMQVMIRPDEQAGVSGDALLVTFMFEYGNSLAGPKPDAVPPLGAENQAVAEFDAETDSQTWYYHNRCDFDQDGAVTWLDFLKIGEYFGEQSADPSSIAAVIAGAGQPVQISAIATIGMHAGSAVESFIVYAGDAAAYPDGGALLGNVDFSESQGDRTVERLCFSFEVADPQPGASYWVRPVCDGAEGIASNTAP